MTDSFAGWDAVETAARVRAKDASAREVVEAAIERAEAAAHLNAIVTPTFDLARRAVAHGLGGLGGLVGPLAGVPTFVKDLAQVGGVRTTWGSRTTGEHVSAKSDPSLARFFGTGVVSLGKSATPEFGLTAATEPLGREPCRNPWDVTRSVGGSSGGAACLVAAGVVPIAHASDGGGSIRIPAACNGLVGLKATRKRFDMDGASLLPVNVAVQGVVSRTVRDTVAFFAALESQRANVAPIGEVRVSPGGLRIALFVESPIGTPVDPEHRAATERAGALCEALGHRVEAISCPFEAQINWDFMRYWGWLAFLYVHGGKLLTHRGFDARQVDPWTRGLRDYFAREPGKALAAIRRLRRLTARYAELMRKYDVLVCPTLAEPPPVLGHLAPDVPFAVAFERLVRFTPFTPIQNAAGAPAISLPLARSARGLPIGVQFAAAVDGERTLLGLALALEEAAPWPTRVTPLA